VVSGPVRFEIFPAAKGKAKAERETVVRERQRANRGPTISTHEAMRALVILLYGHAPLIFVCSRDTERCCAERGDPFVRGSDAEDGGMSLG